MAKQGKFSEAETGSIEASAQGCGLNAPTLDEVNPTGKYQPSNDPALWPSKTARKESAMKETTQGTELSAETLGRYEANTHYTVRDSVRDLRAIANWESCPEGIASCIRILATNIQTAHEGGITARKMLADIEARAQESGRDRIDPSNDIAGEADTFTQAISEFLREYIAENPDDLVAIDLEIQAVSLGRNARRI